MRRRGPSGLDTQPIDVNRQRINVAVEILSSSSRRYDRIVKLEGYDFTYGRKRAGTTDTLRAYGDEHGFQAHHPGDLAAAHPDRTALFSQRGFAIIQNPAPSRGLASSLANLATYVEQ